MKKKNITIEEAKEVWEKIKDNEFVLTMFPDFDNYWKECDRINNMSDEEWYKIMMENKRKLEELK